MADIEGDLTGKRVLLAAEHMAPDFRSEAWRTVDVTGGFGAQGTSGGKMFVRHVEDGSSAYYRRHMIDRVLGDIPADEIEFDYAVTFGGPEGMLHPLSTVRATGDLAAVEKAAMARNGKGGFDFFGRGVYTDAEGTSHIATAIRVKG